MINDSINMMCVERDQAIDSFRIDDSYVELEGPVYKIVLDEGSYFVREGTWFEKDDSGEFQPDWSLTWIYKDKDNPEDCVYYEQDPKGTAVYNFLKSLRRD